MDSHLAHDGSRSAAVPSPPQGTSSSVTQGYPSSSPNILGRCYIPSSPNHTIYKRGDRALSSSIQSSDPALEEEEEEPTLHETAFKRQTSVRFPRNPVQAFTAFNKPPPMQSSHSADSSIDKLVLPKSERGSGFYDTPPLTNIKDPSFKNKAIARETQQSPTEAVQGFRTINNAVSSLVGNSNIDARSTHHHHHPQIMHHPPDEVYSLSSPEVFLANGHSPRMAHSLSPSKSPAAGPRKLSHTGPLSPSTSNYSDVDRVDNDGAEEDEDDSLEASSPQYYDFDDDDDQKDEASDAELVISSVQIEINKNYGKYRALEEEDRAESDSDNQDPAAIRVLEEQADADPRSEPSTIHRDAPSNPVTDNDNVYSAPVDVPGLYTPRAANRNKARADHVLAGTRTPPSLVVSADASGSALAGSAAYEGYYNKSEGAPPKTPGFEDLKLLYGLGPPISRQHVSPTMCTKAAQRIRERLIREMRIHELREKLARFRESHGGAVVAERHSGATTSAFAEEDHHQKNFAVATCTSSREFLPAPLHPTTLPTGDTSQIPVTDPAAAAVATAPPRRVRKIAKRTLISPINHSSPIHGLHIQDHIEDLEQVAETLPLEQAQLDPDQESDLRMLSSPPPGSSLIAIPGSQVSLGTNVSSSSPARKPVSVPPTGSKTRAQRQAEAQAQVEAQYYQHHLDEAMLPPPPQASVPTPPVIPSRAHSPIHEKVHPPPAHVNSASRRHSSRPQPLAHSRSASSTRRFSSPVYAQLNPNTSISSIPSPSSFQRMQRRMAKLEHENVDLRKELARQRKWSGMLVEYMNTMRKQQSLAMSMQAMTTQYGESFSQGSGDEFDGTAEDGERELESEEDEIEDEAETDREAEDASSRLESHRVSRDPDEGSSRARHSEAHQAQSMPNYPPRYYQPTMSEAMTFEQKSRRQSSRLGRSTRSRLSNLFYQVQPGVQGEEAEFDDTNDGHSRQYISDTRKRSLPWDLHDPTTTTQPAYYTLPPPQRFDGGDNSEDDDGEEDDEEGAESDGAHAQVPVFAAQLPPPPPRPLARSVENRRRRSSRQQSSQRRVSRRHTTEQAYHHHLHPYGQAPPLPRQAKRARTSYADAFSNIF